MDPSTISRTFPDQPGRERQLRRSLRPRLAAGGLALAFHLGLLALMVAGSPVQRPRDPEPETPPFVTVMVAPKPPPKRPDRPAGSPPRATASATPPRPAPPAKVATPPRPRIPRATPPPRVEQLAASPAAPEPNLVLGESDLSGATVAGTGGGTGGSGGSGSGGGCDMVRRLQDALRGDPEVTAAVTLSHRALGPGGKAILIWNGEWLRNPGQAGKGLAGVRQAIAMEVAFAPEACRAQAMRGLVVISFTDRPDAPRLALGAREWRWTELLSARR